MGDKPGSVRSFLRARAEKAEAANVLLKDRCEQQERMLKEAAEMLKRIGFDADAFYHDDAQDWLARYEAGKP